jgi:hypothetical protein
VELLTARLHLQALSGEHLAELDGLHHDTAVTTYIGQFGNPDARRRIRSAQLDWSSRGYGLMAITERQTGRFLGPVGLRTLPDFRGAELGWVLRRDAWGLGYPGGRRRMSGMVLGDLRQASVVSLIHLGSTAAVRVACTIGMQAAGTSELHGIGVHVYRAGRTARDKD